MTEILTLLKNLKIMEDILIKETDKQYVELKNNSRDFIETQNSNNRQNVKLKFNKDNFDISKFNKVYSENKIEDVNDSPLWRLDSK